MLVLRQFVLVCALVSVGASWTAHAQQRPDPGALMKAQREAMARLARMDGVWRGPATLTSPSGEKHVITQTERVGPFLDGTIRVIEGRGYEPSGTVSFNAFAVASYDPATQKYTLRSYTSGRSGDFALWPTDDGFVWEIPAGPMTIRYTVTLEDGVWHEVGDRIVPGQEPVRFMEMRLERVGDTDWPAGGAIAPK